MLLSVQRIAPQGSPRTPTARIAATTPRWIVRILNSVFLKILKISNYSVTLTRYRPTPWWWSFKIETCRSTFKYFYCILTLKSTFQEFNPLNVQLNPNSHLLALLRAHHILHVSRIRFNTVLNVKKCVCWYSSIIQVSHSLYWVEMV